MCATLIETRAKSAKHKRHGHGKDVASTRRHYQRASETENSGSYDISWEITQIKLELRLRVNKNVEKEADFGHWASTTSLQIRGWIFDYIVIVGYPFWITMMNWSLFMVRFWLITYNFGVDMQRVTPFKVENTPTLITPIVMWSEKTRHMVQNWYFWVIVIMWNLNYPLFRTFYLDLLWYWYQKLQMFIGYKKIRKLLKLWC